MSTVETISPPNSARASGIIASFPGAVPAQMNEALLYEAFFDLKKTAAVGIDEVTWHDDERGLEEHIPDLHGRIHRGAYRAKPSKRIYLAKPDGRKRPIGIALRSSV